MPPKRKRPTRKRYPAKPTTSSWQKDQKESLLERSRAKGIFETARRGEAFGPHPGYVDLRIELSVYNAISRRREKLPGKDFELLISNIDEVDDMMKVVISSIKRWAEGYIRVTRE